MANTERPPNPMPPEAQPGRRATAVSRRSLRVALAALALVCGATIASPATAPPGPDERDAGGAAVDPIRCWWRTDKQAVHVGERFTLVLTCGVVETIPVTVVADLERLQPASVQLPPFEVLSGTRHQDILARPSRFFQYEYTLRLLGEGFFGQDVDIPSLRIPYRVHSSSGGDTDGRELTYLLPALPMRIMSLVPKMAVDIHDASRRTFGDAEARRFRAAEEWIAGTILLAGGVILLLLGLVRGVGRHRERSLETLRPLPSRVVLRGCLRGIHRVKAGVMRDGWTPELAARALAVFRIVGALALERPVAQAPSRRDARVREGQLMLRSGILRSRRWLVSAPTTANALAADRFTEGSARSRDTTRASVEEIRDALRVFNAARYQRDGELNRTDLDSALELGASGIRGLRFMSVRAFGMRIWNIVRP